VNLEVQSQKGIAVSADILALGFFDEMASPRGLAGEMDWLLNNTLSLLIKGGKISGRFGEVILVSSDRTRTPKIFWIGLGKREEFNHPRITALAADLYRRLEKLEVKEAYIDLWDIEGCQLDFSSALNAFLNGIFQAKKESRSRSIYPASNASERGRLQPALPVEGAQVATEKWKQDSARMRDSGHPGSTQAPPIDIDFVFHTRDPERIKELNRFLKEVDLRSPLSVSAKGD
jgi:leucyl aminopeptidase